MSMVGSVCIWALFAASPQLDAVPAPPLKFESAGAQAMSPTAAITGSPVDGSVACAALARPPASASAASIARIHVRRFIVRSLPAVQDTRNLPGRPERV